MITVITMTIYSVKFALLLKFFFENNGNASVAIPEFSRIKNQWRGSMSAVVFERELKRSKD